MRSAIVFFALLFLLFGLGSMVYAGINYLEYKDRIPQPKAVGLFTGIRAWLTVVHDPLDPSVSDECRKYRERYKIGYMLAAIAMVLVFSLAVTLRAIGVDP